MNNTAITRCERCGLETKGKHDERACPRCHAGPGMQFVRWINPAPIPASRPWGGITGEKWIAPISKPFKG